MVAGETNVVLTEEHLSLILAALRSYQVFLTGKLADTGQVEGIRSIATCDGKYSEPCPEDVDEFAERLNTGYYDL